jgi:hypothetical protein
MRFRLGKSWFSIGFRTGLAVAFASVPFTFISSASAMTVTLASVNNGSGAGNGNGTSTSNTFYFPAYSSANGVASPTSSSSPFTNFQPLDLSLTDATAPQQVSFNITTSSTPNPSPSAGVTSESILVVTVNGGGQTSLAPIIQVAYNGGSLGSCSGSPQCTFLYNNYYHGMIVPSGSFQISLNMAALCNDYEMNQTGNYGSGCASNLLPAPGKNPTVTATNYATFSLNFAVYTVTNPSSITLPIYNPASNTSSFTQTDSATIALNFSNNGITTGATNFQCNLASAYQPKDSAIWVDGTQFSTTATTAASNAPDGLYGSIIFGNLVSSGSFTPITPTVANYSGQSFTINQPVAVQPNQIITGFLNSASASSPNDYALGFIGVDDYGFLFDNNTAPSAPPTTSCGFDFPVQVAAIQGFLQNSHCFIASAAYRGETAPLRMLREFRDQFLEHFGLGRSFVRWYYRWSPDAAEWLIDHPVFRFPVLLALLPLQWFAWLVLHPLIFAMLTMFGFSLIGYWLLKSIWVHEARRKQELQG